jgi:prepilin-type processing-associated H-X9-DG protein
MDQAPQFEYRKKQVTLNRVVTAGLMMAALVVIMFPLLVRAKGRIRDFSCATNLGKIHQAISLYSSDNDDRWPAMVDASDKHLPDLWAGQPNFAAQVKKLPLMHVPLKAYVSNPNVFRCPLDTGGNVMDNSFGSQMQSFLSTPSMFDNYGASYLFRTEITFRSLSKKGFWPSSEIAVLFDGYGHWHAGIEPIDMNTPFKQSASAINKYRYNALFGDGHVDKLTFRGLQTTWNNPL